METQQLEQRREVAEFLAGGRRGAADEVEDLAVLQPVIGEPDHLPVLVEIDRDDARQSHAEESRENLSGSKLSLRGGPHPLASREALTYRAALRIATCAGNLWDPLAEPIMLWPFNHFRKPHAPQRGTIEAIYG